MDNVHTPLNMGKQVYSDFHIQIRALAKLRDNPISRCPEKARKDGPGSVENLSIKLANHSQRKTDSLKKLYNHKWSF